MRKSVGINQYIWPILAVMIVMSPYAVIGTAGNFNSQMDILPLMQDFNSNQVMNSLNNSVHNIDTNETFSSIQQAIDDSDTMNGHTIEVSSGTYYENLVINKSVSLIGENKNNTIIDGRDLDSTIHVTADWVNVSSFTITNGTDFSQGSGIYVHAHHCRFFNNNVSGNLGYGIALSLYATLNPNYDNWIMNNTITNNGDVGLQFWETNTSYIIGNYFSNNSQDMDDSKGVAVSNVNSAYLTFIDNQMVGDGITIMGYDLAIWNTHSIDTSNTVDGSPVYYWKNQVGGTLPTDGGQIILGNCSNLTIENQSMQNKAWAIIGGYVSDSTIRNNSFENNVYGLFLVESDNNYIENNTAFNNYYGFRLSASINNGIKNNLFRANDYGLWLSTSSSYNILQNNIFALNSGKGLYVYGLSDYNSISNNSFMYNGLAIQVYEGSSNNTITNNTISDNGLAIIITIGWVRYGSECYDNMIYHNSFINNNDWQGFHGSSSSLNYWDNGYPSGGNYWDDYNGTDMNSTPTQDVPPSDGIGDVPFTNLNNGGVDNYPLMGLPGLNRPIAAPKPNFNEGMVGDTISFNGALSFDPDGNIVSYIWNFGDGNSAVGMYVNHTYSMSGNYTVKLAVVDDDGLSDIGICNARIYGTLPPQAEIFVMNPDAIVNESVVFFSSSYDPDGTIVSYYWDFDDGHIGTEQFLSHKYMISGNYTVTLTVTDNDGMTGMDSCFVNITGTHSPVAVTEPSYQQASVGQMVDFYGNSSYDPDGIITWYHWDFGDGFTTESDNATTPSHQYLISGNYTVKLTVTDNEGNTDEDSCIVDVYGVQAPIAIANPGYQEVSVYEAVPFDGSSSFDPDGIIVSYHWDFDDGHVSTDMVTTHVYSAAGNYSVSLTVTDNDGMTHTDTCIVSALGTLPPVAIPKPYYQEVMLGFNASFNGSLSYDPDGIVVTYLWDFGDGTNGTGAFVNHSYNISGIFTVTLTVIDGEGFNDSSTCIVQVRGSLPPVSLIYPEIQNISVNQSASFFGNQSYDPDGVIISYFWSFGDGQTATTANPQHNYSMSGQYNVTLTTVDNDGLTSIDYCLVNVTGLRFPIAVIGPSYQECEIGEAAIFDGNQSLDPDGTIVQYLWDFGDGQTGSGSLATHLYDEPGDYIVTLTVTDNDGFTDTDTCLVSVKDTLPPTITDVHVAPLQPNNRARITILGRVADNVGLDSVTLTYLHNGTEWRTLQMGNDVSDIYSIVFGPVNQSFTYYINATDISGNTASYSDEVIVRTVNVETEDEIPSAEDIEEGSVIRITGTVYVDGELNGTGFTIVVLLDGEIYDSCVVSDDGSYELEFTLPPGRTDDTMLEIQLLDSITGMKMPISSFILPIEQSFSWFFPLMIGSIIVATGGLTLATEVGKFAFLLFFLPLYTKLKKEEVLDTYTRGRIHGYITANPGEHYNAIKRALGLNNGSLAYHLSVLDKEGLIKSKTSGMYKRFYPKDMILPNGGPVHLTEAQKLILKKVEETPGISQKDIAALLGISASTVNYHMVKLVEMNAVRTERKGIGVRYFMIPMSVEDFISVNSSPEPELSDNSSEASSE